MLRQYANESPEPLGTSLGAEQAHSVGGAYKPLEVKMRCASEWVGWGQLSDDGSGHYNPNRSEGPWGRT